MMQVTFLAHSGFLVELSDVVLLFDWWKGELPSLPDKPLLVFASHSHEDHFSTRIFSLDDGSRTVRFLLGKDIRLTPRRRKLWSLSDETADKCLRLRGGDCTEALPGLMVEALPSTDAGVAFLITVGETTIYHAGDLHWWHWEGEPDPWNPNMERDFKAYTAPLKDRHIDLAMVPLDSRLGAAEDWGLAYLFGIAAMDHVLPMHQWGDYAATARFMVAHPQWAGHILPITEEGQHFTLP